MCARGAQVARGVAHEHAGDAAAEGALRKGKGGGVQREHTVVALFGVGGLIDAEIV